MNKHEQYIMDTREHKKLIKKMEYWKFYINLPEEEQQRNLDNYGIHSKYKEERKYYRKMFAKQFISHSYLNAVASYVDCKKAAEKLAKDIEIRRMGFGIIDRLKIWQLETNPKSTVNSPSWNFMQMGKIFQEEFKKEFKKVIEEAEYDGIKTIRSQGH